MANTLINKTENYIEENQITHETAQNIFHLGTSYVVLKVSKKNPEEKQEPFGLRKRGKNEIYEGKGKWKERREQLK